MKHTVSLWLLLAWTPALLVSFAAAQAAPRPAAHIGRAVRTVRVTSSASCAQRQTGCVAALVSLMNAQRVQRGVAPLSIDWVTSKTDRTSPCYGERGHAVHMANMGTISHDQFPLDICAIAWHTVGENVGMAPGDKWGATQTIFNEMMAERHDPATCAQTTNHACNILSGAFTRVGIGYAQANGYWFIGMGFSG